MRFELKTSYGTYSTKDGLIFCEGYIVHKVENAFESKRDFSLWLNVWATSFREKKENKKRVSPYLEHYMLGTGPKPPESKRTTNKDIFYRSPGKA